MRIEFQKTSIQIKEKKYPWLGITDKDVIVLFTGHNKGIALNASDPSSTTGVCQYSIYWSENNFKPYVGTIILENDQ